MSPVELMLAVLAITWCLFGAGIILALRALTRAVEEVPVQLRGLEAVGRKAVETADTRLHELDSTAAQHTVAVREAAAAAPEEVTAQRDQLAADNERLMHALEAIVTFRPDPQKGTYGAGVQDVLDYAKQTMKAVL